jgi:FkbM family methyltransferase
MSDLLNPEGFNEIKKCRYGTFLFNKNDWPIGTSLRNYGEYAFEELSFLKQMINPDHVVIDAGANIGTHTVWFSQLAGTVISFEPQRIAFQTLNANVALNNCLNVHTFHAALGSECGSIIVPVRDQYKPNNFGGVPLAGETEGEPTTLMTIDSLELSRCDFIKADIEGMEAEFLIGAAHTIAKFRPILYMEADGAEAKEAIKMLMELGYECYWSVPNLFNPNNIEGYSTDVFLQSHGTPICSINMLCIPSERNVVVNGLKKIESSDESTNVFLNVHDDEAGREYIKQIEERKHMEIEHD